MNISPIQQHKTFKGVYALIGTCEQLREATNLIALAKGDSLTLSATSLFRNKKIDSPFSQYVVEGKSISLVVTGDDVHKVCSHKPMWTTLDEIAKQIDKYILLKDIKQQMRAIKKTMTK